MDKIRRPFQGVLNIIRFNRHFYVLSIIFLLLLFVLNNYVPAHFHFYFWFIIVAVFATTLLSLLASYYVYDVSGLYTFNWLADSTEELAVININAGFDETSSLLQAKFTNARLIVLDFYDPALHTEVSIKRARKAYPPYPGTRSVKATQLSIPGNSADKIFVTLAAHEIRNDDERIIFFAELFRVIRPGGQICITEHVRDTANFLAYNIGFFHFLSKATWYRTFKFGNLQIVSKKKVTPFITIFTLEKNGTAS